MSTIHETDSAKSEPSVRCIGWLGRILLWWAKRDIEKSIEKLIWCEESLRLTKQDEAATDLRQAMGLLHQSLRRMRPNVADQRRESDERSLHPRG
jgi:hypothetical protein